MIDAVLGTLLVAAIMGASGVLGAAINRRSTVEAARVNTAPALLDQADELAKGRVEVAVGRAELRMQQMAAHYEREIAALKAQMAADHASRDQADVDLDELKAELEDVQVELRSVIADRYALIMYVQMLRTAIGPDAPPWPEALAHLIRDLPGH